MKELNRFREFLSENALGIDKGDGTFEITPDIEIMGQSFNFSDICPSAHKAIANLAKEYANNDVMLGDLLYLANLHKTFFNLEKKALGPQRIDADDLNNIKELYVDINNIANNAFGEEVGKEVKTYMDMHMGKIKDAGLKASEPGGSSDRNFEEQLAEVRNRLENEIEGYTDLHKNDVALEAFLGEEELEENKKYADDQLKFKKGDTVYFKNVKGGKKLPMTITGPGKFMKSNRLDAGGKEVVFPVKGGPGGKGMYAADDLIKEDLEEEKLNEGKYKVSISKNGSPSETILFDTEEKANAAAKKINGGFMDYEGAKFKATVAKNLEEGPYGSTQTGYQVNYKTMDNKVVSAGSEVFASEDEAKSFMEKIKTDPKTISVKIWEFYGPGSTGGGGAQYMGGMKEFDSYTHPAYYKKRVELSPEEESIKNYLGSPSFTHKRYGITQDFKLMDIIDQQKADRKAYIASLDESLEE